MTTERDDVQRLLASSPETHAPSLGNLVGEQWRNEPDTLGQRHAHHRDSTILGFIADGLTERPGPRRMLDLGCAYGNHVFMTNARLGLDQDVQYTGVELAAERLAYANSFATAVPGYANCTFLSADIEEPLPFDDDTFDVVNLADVIEHLPDPEGLLRELKRVTRPGGSIIVSTPQRETPFKSLAKRLDRLSRGRLYSGYYHGKETELDEQGHPVMEVDAGHDHISEMNIDELLAAGERAGLTVGDVELMNIMSGSTWFDRHPVVLGCVLVAESVHRRLQVRSWAHAVVARFVA